MRKILLPLLFLLLYFTANAQTNEQVSYYYKGQKVYYPVSYDRLVVGIAPGRSFNQLKGTVASLIAISADSLQETLDGKQFLIKLGHKVKDIAPLISKLKQNNSILYARPVFLSESGKYNSYGDEFIVNMKPTTSFASLQNLIQQTGSRLVRKYPFQEDMYILAAGQQANYDGLAMANLFYETNLFDYAEPNKYVYDAKHVDPTDPLYYLQWAHKNTGSAAQFNGTPGADMKVQEAWAVSMGSATIKIGVIDEGVDLTHPDLQANLLQGFHGGSMSSGPGDGGPTYAGGAHGTNCAGIIAGIANNGIGVAGVAPNCKIIPTVIFGGTNGAYLGDAAVAACFDYVRTNAGDVISNSWGGGSVSATIDAAIDRAVTLGRGGLGCIVLFSSGNDNSVVAYPANNPQVISVGGINMCNQRKSPTSCDGETWWGANFGTGLNIVAPCVKIASTDIQGTAGYNTLAGVAGDYFETFNGTSSSCPNAAGVAALILSVNSTLTLAQATAILELSCDKIPGYSFATTAGQPNGTWNNELGHGRVNALTAVQMALICPRPTIAAPTVTQAVCPSTPASIVVNATGSGTIEYSLNGGTYQTSNTFSNLSAGNYYITARIQGGDPNCIAFYGGNPVVINQPPSTIVFTAPGVTQPACPSPVTGTIVVNATGSGTLEYRLNGGAYQSSNTFSGLAPGSYNISARLQGTTACTENYSGNPVVISPANTAVSTISYTGPAVAIPDGNLAGVDIPLVVSGLGTSITDLNFRFDANSTGTCDAAIGNTNAAVDHTWLGDLIFSLTSPGGTTVTFINQAGGGGFSGNNICTATIDDDGGFPSIQTVTTAPIAGNFSPASLLSAFDGEAPNGTWILHVEDVFSIDVGSVRRFSLIITAASPCPAVPTVTTTGTLNAFTACAGTASAEQSFTVSGSNLTNNLTVTAPAGFQVSTTPGSDFASSIPPLVPSGGNVPSTTIYVRMAADATGTPSGNIACASAGATTANVAVSGTVTALPVISAPGVTQPSCTTPTGTIVVNATGGGTLEYSVNGGSNYFTSNTFSGLAPGNYNIRVRSQSNPSCFTIYSGNPVVLVAATGCCVPPSISAPSVTQPSCGTPTGTIVVNASGGGTLEYSVNGGSNFFTSNTFSGLAPGNYNIRVRLQASPSCFSDYASNPIVLTAATGCGNCTITCPANKTVNSAAGQCGKYVTYPAATKTGTCGPLTYSHPSGSWFPVGTTTVTVSSASTGASCTFTVTVNDNQLPVITVPANIVVNAAPNTCSKVVNFVVSATDNCPGLTLTAVPASGNVFNTGVTTVVVTATDASGNTSTKNFTVTVKESIKPVISCPSDITVNADPGVCNAIVDPGTATAIDNCPGAITITGTRNDGEALNAPYPVGVTTITWKAKDGSGNQSTCKQKITVVDNQAPVITGVSATPSVLWPANHTMKVITVNYTVTDNCGPENNCPITTVLSVTSNEPITGQGPGDLSPDWIIVDANKVKLRAERNPNGNGRIYAIKITSSDVSGNSSIYTVFVTVPITAPAPTGNSGQNPGDKVIDEKIGLTAQLMPNPTENEFSLVVRGGSNEMLDIRVMDISGREVQRIRSAANNVARFGNNLGRGTYIIEVRQGKEKIVLKAVKQ